jgi:hypothetical protein
LNNRSLAAPVQSTVFFVDDRGPCLWSLGSVHKAFSEVLAELARRHDSFPTRYAVNLYPGDPMRIPTSKLTMRALRHTCITALHDAGRIRKQIRAITGHSMSSIDEILKRYTALTTTRPVPPWPSLPGIWSVNRLPALTQTLDISVGNVRLLVHCRGIV